MIKGKVPVKKIISIICTVLTVLVVALAAFIIINMIYCRAKNKPVSFFGVSFAIVQTKSMEPEIMRGDLIIFRMCGVDDVKVGDNVVFRADNNFDKAVQGKSIVHKVVRIENGIETRGVNNANDDGGFRDADELFGICTYNSAGWGKLFTFLSKYGIFFIIALVAVPFIVKQIIKIVKLSKQKEDAEVPAAVLGAEQVINVQEEKVEEEKSDIDDGGE